LGATEAIYTVGKTLFDMGRVSSSLDTLSLVINAYSAAARPIRWKYSEVSHRIRSYDLAATRH
jgi:hypothetical protein